MPPNTVKVCRPTVWGNPFVVGREYVRRRMVSGGGQSTGLVVDREHAVRLYRRFTAREMWLLIEAEQLRGKNLACWCPLDQPCHADVLLEMANAPIDASGESASK